VILLIPLTAVGGIEALQTQHKLNLSPIEVFGPAVTNPPSILSLNQQSDSAEACDEQINACLIDAGADSFSGSSCSIGPTTVNRSRCGKDQDKIVTLRNDMLSHEVRVVLGTKPPT
jgi:hypothetical protein